MPDEGRVVSVPFVENTREGQEEAAVGLLFIVLGLREMTLREVMIYKKTQRLQFQKISSGNGRGGYKTVR